MPTFLQPVPIPDRCFLFEVLLWVAFARLPLAESDPEGEDFRESPEYREEGLEGYPVKVIDDYVFETECERARIPIDPRWKAVLEDNHHSSVKFYDEFLKHEDLLPDQRERLTRERQEALEFEEAVKTWKVEYKRAVEYPASLIFVALKDGSLPAFGRLLPFRDLKRAVRKLAREELDLFDIERTPIPPSFWTLQGIDFEGSCAVNHEANYCHITCSLEDVLSRFPGERQPAKGIEKIGDSFIVSDDLAPAASKARRGRPPYNWEAFRAEVAAVIQNGELPDKKEAAIHRFQDWFHSQFGVRPSRAAIGEKLTPYYETHMRNAGQKVR